MKNVNIMGVHKKTIYMGNCLKRRQLEQFVGGLAKNREGAFEGGNGSIPQCALT